MASLIQTYGQPHQLSLQRIARLMEEPTIRSGDTAGFRFALRVRALVGMLEQLGEDGRIELRCGSHVARLLRKLPQDLRATFRRYLYSRRDGVPSLMDFAEWLESSPGLSSQEALNKPKAYCPYCSNTQHFLDQCLNFKQLTKEQKATWVKSNNHCWRCGRHHQAAQCRLKVLCKTLRCYFTGEHTLETYAILDDGSERTILLQDAAKRLQLQGTPESLILRTGPVKSLQQYSHQQQCLFLATTSQAAELFKQVEKLWQLDTLPYRSERLVTRSRRDEEATNLLEAKTTRVEVEEYSDAPPAAAEKRLSRDPVKAEAYRAEIMKLEKTGYATRRHVHDHSHQGDEVCESIERHFYVDNWLQSFSSPDGAKEVIDKLRGLLMEGGFELRQWASNIPEMSSATCPRRSGQRAASSG
ncbi:hypothetical protein AAFF_G00427910 [Aldrovandia affinis]|uniref:Peptidase aspartic putative domain-containing protein n=1 Tax=Aldrovandia affinis TaxID=143900 RepID=A0AAD7R5B3_9TELE|nr:hypothetical protein AAFF_G00427910 [Aldrovandia affinis]